MKLQFYGEKLESSDIFKEFKKENPKSYLCSAFIVVDKEGKDNKIHLDYFIPETREMVSFHLNEEVSKVPLETYDDKTPEKISLEDSLSFKEIEEIIENKMKAENLSNKIQKIILSLQKLNDEDILAGTVFITMLGMIKIKIDAKNKNVIDFEKKSLMDIMNVLKRKDK